MTFNVYRTTKGKLGEPVLAEMQVTNPRTGADYVNIFPIREYYTNQQLIRPEILAGSMGDLKIEIRCISPTQYLGMAESDLYLLSSNGNFGANYMKGLFGVWLQAMVLTAIGVFAGTFLSWPVALLTTIAFFFAGQLLYNFLVDFTRQAVLGGGPVRIADPAGDPRQPDERAGAHRGRRHRQDARFPGHAGDVDARLHRPQLPGARREQLGGRRLRGQLVHHDRQYAPGPGLRLAVLDRRILHPQEP